MAAAEGGSCCPAGSLPALQEDDSRTLSGTVDGSIYYSAPPSADCKRGIVVIYDVFGFSGGRIKSVCDQIALAGFHVAMPDVYNGTDIDAEGGFGNEAAMAWLKTKSDYNGFLKAAIQPALDYLAAKGATGGTGALGFCWGAYGVVKLACDGKIGAGVSTHPSLKIGKMFFDEDEAQQVKPTKAPLQFLPAGNDDALYTDGSLVAESGVEVASRAFPDMQHGWVPRGDTSDPAVARDVELALKASTDFFAKHLSE